MPRRSRIAFAQMPHHIVQRGHRRQQVFFNRSDYVDYLGTLAEFRVTLGLRVYAYCLMTNHVHLVVNPMDDVRVLGELMKRLAARHTRRLNREFGWSGSIWEGRFKCSPIDSERYFLACGRYVDANPVRARMVATPADFEWSSYHVRAGFAENVFLDPDPSVEALSPDIKRRHEIYRELAATPLHANELEMIRNASQRNQLTGEDQFIDLVAETQGITVPARPRGRPRKRRAA